MVAAGADVFTVMAISGHSSVRMLERYTHPATPAKLEALESATVAPRRRPRHESRHASDARNRESSPSPSTK